MIENSNPNTFASPDKKRRARFSLPTGDRAQLMRKHSRRESLLARKESDSPLQSPLNSSSDAEWANYQATLNTVKSQMQNIDESDGSFDYDDETDNAFIKHLELTSPANKRMSIGTINNARSEIALMRRDLELDNEIQALDNEVAAMQEAFISMYAEITQQRIVTELKDRNKSLEGLEVAEEIKNLDLSCIDPMQWATEMEKIADKYLV